MRRSLWLWAAAITIAAAAAAAAWLLPARALRAGGGVELGTLPPGVSRDRLNLIVVTLDTTRADRIGAYGARDVETPAVDRLASEGVLFEQAVTGATVNPPGHSTLLIRK